MYSTFTNDDKSNLNINNSFSSIYLVMNFIRFKGMKFIDIAINFLFCYFVWEFVYHVKIQYFTFDSDDLCEMQLDVK